METKEELLKQFEAVFRGYHDTLRNKIECPTEKIEGDELHVKGRSAVVAIEAKWNTHGYDKWTDAVELLVLLADVDWKAWKQHVKEIWPESNFDERLFRPPSLVVDVQFDNNGRDNPFSWLGMTSQTHCQSIELVEARNLAQKIFALDGKIVTEVPVRLFTRYPGAFAEKSNLVMQLALAHTGLASLNSDNRSRIGAEEAPYNGMRVREFRLTGTLVLDVSCIECLGVVAANGIVIDDLGMISPDAHARCPRAFVQSLWSLLAIEVVGDGTWRGGARQMSVNLASPTSMIPSVFSAIRTSGSLRVVTIEPSGKDEVSPEQRRELWKWITYAVFCGRPRVSKRLQKVELNVEAFTASDLAVVYLVLKANDPLVSIVGRDPSLTKESISVSRLWLHNPTSGSDDNNASSTVSCTNVLRDLSVLNRFKEWTTVLLPGWGEAWAHRDDIVAVQHVELRPVEVQSIERVSLTAMSEDAKAHVMKLLRQIGSGVRHLRIQGVDSVFHITEPRKPPLVLDGWCDDLFTACPNLEGLEIERAQLDTVQFLLDGYVSGTCKLETFKVSNRFTNLNRVDKSLQRFFVALGDKTHPAARYLREFVYYRVTIDDVMKKAMQSTVLTMLSQNKRLRVFDLRYLAYRVTKARQERCTQTFKVFDEEEVPCLLDLKERLAFLSVLGHETTSSGQANPMESLDADVLSLIFRMAASREKRRVYVGAATEEAGQE